jgi:hypothetical protein
VPDAEEQCEPVALLAGQRRTSRSTAGVICLMKSSPALHEFSTRPSKS